VDCVKFADDDYLNHPTVKAFHERMEKEGAPGDWPDYEEAWQAWSAFEARERATHFARADGWQLVLQVPSDDEVGPWTGYGCLYVCIRKSDLAELRFDRCWTLLQEIRGSGQLVVQIHDFRLERLAPRKSKQAVRECGCALGSAYRPRNRTLYVCGTSPQRLCGPLCCVQITEDKH
jgi:hypothetical protein